MKQKEKWYALEFIASYYNYVKAIGNFETKDGDVIIEIYEDKNKDEIGELIDCFTFDKYVNDSIDAFTFLEEFYYYNDGYYYVRIYQN